MRRRLPITLLALGCGGLLLALFEPQDETVGAAPRPRPGRPEAVGTTPAPRPLPARTALSKRVVAAPTGPTAAPPAVAAVATPPPPARESTPLNLASLFEALRDDDIPHNAYRAAGTLQRLLYRDDTRVAVMNHAERLLFSDDDQQRLAVTSLLVIACSWIGDPDYRPHPELLRRIPGWIAGAPALPDVAYIAPSTNDAVRFCRQYIDLVEDDLVRFAHGSDLSLRFRAAVVLGTERREAHADLVGSVLRPHLADNHRHYDALESVEALQSMGPAILPSLSGRGVDPQQDHLLRSLRAELSGRGMDPELKFDKTISTLYGPDPVPYWRQQFYMPIQIRPSDLEGR